MHCSCAILSSVTCHAQKYFSTSFHKWHDFLKKKVNTICVLQVSVQFLPEIFFILRRTERDMIEECIFVFM
jgi:hypothetical protein